MLQAQLAVWFAAAPTSVRAAPGMPAHLAPSPPVADGRHEKSSPYTACRGRPCKGSSSRVCQPLAEMVRGGRAVQVRRGPKCGREPYRQLCLKRRTAARISVCFYALVAADARGPARAHAARARGGSSSACARAQSEIRSASAARRRGRRAPPAGRARARRGSRRPSRARSASWPASRRGSP